MRIQPGRVFAEDSSADELLNAIADGLSRSDETQVIVDWQDSIVVASTYNYFYQRSRQVFSATERQRISFENVSLSAKIGMRSAIRFAELEGVATATESEE